MSRMGGYPLAMRAFVLNLCAWAVLAPAPSFAALSINQSDLWTPRRSSIETVVIGLEARPREARYELGQLYWRYTELVNERLAQGWRAELLSGEIIEHQEEAILPIRQAEEALAKREAELKLLDGEALLAKDKEVKRARRRLKRSKGLSIDWSDAVWAELMKTPAGSWSISDLARTAQPRHTAAVVCTPPEKPELCLAFDPWTSGEANVYEFWSWDQGSFQTRIPPEYFLHHLPEHPDKNP